MKRTDIKANQASALMSNLLPVIHEKIKVLMGNVSSSKPELKKETDIKEEEPAEEETSSKKLFDFKKKEEEAEDEKEVSSANPVVDKVLMAVIGVCLLAIIVVLVFILVKVNM